MNAYEDARQITSPCGKNHCLQTTLLVSDVLKSWPQAERVFLHYKTGCVGCLLARFCTLEDVATYYNLDLDALLTDIQSDVDSSPT